MDSSDPRNTGPRPGNPPAVGDTLFRGKGLFWYPIAPLVLLDLWSKSAVFAHVTAANGGHFNEHNRVGIFSNDWFGFELVTWLNRGTIWGLGNDWHEMLKFLRLGAIALILYFVYRTLSERRTMLVALGLILAGALGNMYDNFIHWDPEWSDQKPGAVRDFLHFRPYWEFPAFNVADSCITVGACTLFVLLWRTDTVAEPRVEETRGSA